MAGEYGTNSHKPIASSRGAGTRSSRLATRERMVEGDRDAEDAKDNWWRSGQPVRVRQRSERHWPIGHLQRETAKEVTSTHRGSVAHTDSLALSSLHVSFMHAFSSLSAQRVNVIPRRVGKVRHDFLIYASIPSRSSLPPYLSLERGWERFHATTELVITTATSLKLPRRVVCPGSNT